MGLPLPDGTMIQNRYRILRVLGQGGFGRTYLAEDTNRFDELCVIKEFDPQTQGGKHAEKAKELFAREAGVLYRLQHPQIPQFRELLRVKTQNQELLFLVQDYVNGKTYQELLEDRRQKRSTFTEFEAQQLLEQLLPVLAYLHQSGIVHRDISPDNIILRNSDQKPVLIDFGVVKAAASQAVQHSSQTFVGKPGFAPVEQIKQGKADPTSDLYALAMTIAVLLTGRDAQSLMDPMTLECQWKKYGTVSPLFAQVLDRMMSNRPSDRYASARDVHQALSMVSQAPQAAIVHSPPSHQVTMAVGRRSRSRTTRIRTGQYPRTWVDSAFDAPLALINGVYWLIKGTFKLAFGLVRFTVGGILKLVFRVVLWVIAIVSLIWLVPQILPYFANAVPRIPELPSINRPGSRTNTAQIPNYEAECQRLGIDYTEFIGEVNQEFYRKYPDREGTPLSQGRSDERLRKEWHRIAQRLLEQRAKELKSQNKLAEY
jgi:serine/threonine-protein kinase